MSIRDPGSDKATAGSSPAALELLNLVHDLRTHLDWANEICPAELIPADEAWIATRREQYRSYQVADAPLASLAAPELPTLRSADPTLGGPLALPSVEVATSTVTPVAATPAAVTPVAVTAVPPTPALPTPLTPVIKPAVVKPAALTLPATAEVRVASSAGSLTVLQEQVASCTRCSLSTARTQTVFARGTTRSGIVFVGEGPGADEDAQGYPFVGKAGQLLDRMIEAMGMARDDVYICNVVKCRPPDNRKPEESEMAACRPFLTEQLELLSPKVIVALGATAVQGLLGLSMGITRLRGQWRLYRGQIPVMPTFHPAYLLRQPTAKREVWQDLQAVLDHMGLKPPKRGDSTSE